MLVLHAARVACVFASMERDYIERSQSKAEASSAVCYDDFIMKMSRFSRLVAASVMLFSLLFAQLAVAAYACPASGNGSPAVHKLLIDPEMSGCRGMSADQQSPSLCAAHCDNTPQSAEIPSTPAAAPFIPVTLCVVLDKGDLACAIAPLSEGLQLNQAAAPPLIIRNCSFQI